MTSSSTTGAPPRGPTDSPGTAAVDRIGLLPAISIGIGGMVGAGIFSILGVVAGVAGGGLPVASAVGGVVALFAAYSYVRLGVCFPSAGGAVTFMVEGYGDGISAGTANVFLYFSYVIAIALYARGFAGYATTFWHVPEEVFAVGVVVTYAGSCRVPSTGRSVSSSSSTCWWGSGWSPTCRSRS